MVDNTMKICPQCNGYGTVGDMDYTGKETIYDCDKCDGMGEISKQ